MCSTTYRSRRSSLHISFMSSSSRKLIPASPVVGTAFEEKATPARVGRSTLSSPRSKARQSYNKVKNNPNLSPSIYRPRVLARDRLLHWTTPFAIARTAHLLHDHTPAALDNIRHVAASHLDSTTRTTYASGLIRFNQYCDSEHVPESRRMPASEVLLSAFIASWAGKISRSTVDTWLSGLEFWHTVNGAPWHASVRSGHR